MNLFLEPINNFYIISWAINIFNNISEINSEKKEWYWNGGSGDKKMIIVKLRW
jgi:hypothetical protein